MNFVRVGFFFMLDSTLGWHSSFVFILIFYDNQLPKIVSTLGPLYCRAYKDYLLAQADETKFLREGTFET